MLEDTGVCLQRKTREPRDAQTSIAQKLTHEEFVATVSSALEYIVREAQGLVCQGCSEDGSIPDGENGVERLRACVIQDLLGCLLRSLETQR
jgi:hypothetical protein